MKESVSPGEFTRHPFLVDHADGSVERMEVDGRVSIRTRGAEKKPLIYFEVPTGTWIAAPGDTAVFRVEYYSHGTPGDSFMIEYDSYFSDDIDGYYHDSEIVEKPEEPGWYTAVLEGPKPAFTGRQNSNADFRISSLGDGDEYIGGIEIQLR